MWWFKIPPTTAAFCAQALRLLAAEHERMAEAGSFVNAPDSLARLESDRASALDLVKEMETGPADQLHYLSEHKVRILSDALEAASFREPGSKALRDALAAPFARPQFYALPDIRPPEPPEEDYVSAAAIGPRRPSRPS